jgi:hypothetical protein
VEFADYIRGSVSNGQPHEQALIRRWWRETQGARGLMVWEYYLGDCFADGMWFPEAKEHGTEIPGSSRNAYPIAGVPVVLCEAKLRLTPELIGQALVYGSFARRAGADVRSIVIFAKAARPAFVTAAEELGLKVVL